MILLVLLLFLQFLLSSIIGRTSFINYPTRYLRDWYEYPKSDMSIPKLCSLIYVSASLASKSLHFIYRASYYRGTYKLSSLVYFWLISELIINEFHVPHLINLNQLQEFNQVLFSLCLWYQLLLIEIRFWIYLFYIQIFYPRMAYNWRCKNILW